MLTCAHNIYDRTRETEATNIYFSPRVNGNQGESLPVKSYFFHEKYKTETVENEKNKYDIGLLELEKDLLEDYGYLGIDSRGENMKEGD